MIRPSTNMCGLRSRISRSLNVPGSPSSALTTRYLGKLVSLRTKFHFMPVGNPAPPRPRRFDFTTSSTICWGGIFSAFASAWYPPPAR
jgi:hypothetical protein